MGAKPDRRRNPLKEAANDRERLLGWPRILVLGVTIVVAMVYLYPRDRLVEQVSRSEAHDELTKSYLDNLLKNDPDNPGLLIKRADAEIEAGREAQGEALLAGLAGSSDTRVSVEAAEALVRLRERQLFAQTPGSRARQERLEVLHQAMIALDRMPLEPARRAELARKASVHGAEDLALAIYRRLAGETQGDEASTWLEEGARAAQSLGRYQEASKLYFDARRVGVLPERRVANYLAGVRALQAGNMPLDALAAAEAELGDLSENSEVLLFVVRLARAANRNDRAEIYVRKLLRYVLEGVAPGGVRRVVAPAVRQMEPATRTESIELSRGHPACSRSDDRRACWERLPGAQDFQRNALFLKAALGPQLPFNEEIYLQGYEVFVANRKLQDAQLVAEAAVRQVPDNAAWRERLARVAEWNGKPTVALEHWRRLALAHDSDVAWQAVLRLAPGLFDEESVVLALTREYRVGRLDDARLVRLVEAFDALGEPRRGIDFLREAYRNRPRRLLLSQKAWLEERSGQVDQAIGTLRQIEQTYGLQGDEPRRLAGMLLSSSRPAEAYAVLQQYSHEANGRDRDYLELVAELGWRLQDYPSAKAYYRSLHATGALEDYQLERLITLLRDDSPAAAVDLAVSRWESNHSPRFFQLALELHLQNRNPAAAKALLERLSPADARTLEKQTPFLRLRADIRRETGDLPGAIGDVRRALKRAPSDIGLNAQLIWLLIEARDRGQLATELGRRHPAALDEPELWDSMGAGYVFLSRPAHALPYYSRQAERRHDDYLWLMNYAQVLEDAGQADMGWRLRRHAWLNLRPADPAPAKRLERLRVLARSALRLAPGDAGAAWLRELLRQDVDGEGQLSPQAKELATAWLIGDERFDAARFWLSQQYGSQLAAPRWAEVALALQRNDTSELRRIVDDDQGDIEASARAEAAIRLKDYAAANRVSTAGLEVDLDNEILHLKLTESLWLPQNRVSLAYRSEELGALRSEGWRADAQVHVAPRLRMSVEISQDRLSSTHLQQLTNVPAHDSRVSVAGLVTHDLGETGFKLFRRDALSGFTGAELTHRYRPERRLLAGGAIGYNVEADENAALRAAGVKDVLKLNGEWLLSKREYLLVEAFAARYYEQGRQSLGQGSGVGIQFGHHLRTEYPNATLKFMAGTYQFRDRSDGAGIRGLLPSSNAVLPESFNQFGFGVDLGTVASDQYSRTFRPYASLDFLHSSRSGWGYGLGMGFVFSPTGNDWLRGRYRGGRSRFSSSEDASLLELEYRYLF